MSEFLQNKFNQGRSIDAVKAEVMQAGGRSASMWTLGEEAAANGAIDFTPLEKLDAPVNILVLSEEWCPDCTDGLPILDRLAKVSGKLNVSVLKRDEHYDVADLFLNKGLWRSIPTLVVLDENFDAVGHIAERPDSVTERRNVLRKEMHAEHPEYGGFDARPDELDEDVRANRMAAEVALKATTSDWSVPMIAEWMADAATSTSVK